MLLYCLRHGQSQFNAEGRIQGQQDAALSELGIKQAEALVTALAGQGIEAIYSSPLARALGTAEPIGRALRLPIRTDPRLMEIRAGVFENHLRSDLDRLFPEEYARWRSGDPDYAMPGGESRHDLMRRGAAALADIAAAGYERAAVVTHGGLLVAAFKALLGVPAGRHPFELENGSLSVLRLGEGEPKLLALNLVDHLRDVGLAGGGDLA